MTRISIGIDDTDSHKGMCTTYLCTRIVKFLLDYAKVRFLDFPKLVRLNPNIPWKTRGNGATGIHIEIPPSIKSEIKEKVIKEVETNAELQDPATDPGVVFVEGEIPKFFRKIAKEALHNIVPLSRVKKAFLLPDVDITIFKEGRGAIGAISALGNPLNGDHTYELLVYRKKASFGTPRKIDRSSVIRADDSFPLTFSNYDYENNEVKIIPHGNDPVYCGIRGEDPESISGAWNLIQPLEPISFAMVFRTNQGTDDHLTVHYPISHLRSHCPGVVTGTVWREPYQIRGRHIIFSIKDNTGEVDCAAYEPTKKFRNKVKELRIGDEVSVYGGVRPKSLTPLTLNVEKFIPRNLVETSWLENPPCPHCRKKMKSAGKNKGFRCKKCKIVSRTTEKVIVTVERSLSSGKVYIPPVCAHRHLTKPKKRYGREKKEFQHQGNINLILKGVMVSRSNSGRIA